MPLLPQEQKPSSSSSSSSSSSCPSRRHSFDLLDGAAGGLVEGHRAVRVLDAVTIEDLEALLLPGAGGAEDRNLLGGGGAPFAARFYHPPGDAVDAPVRHDRQPPPPPLPT